MLHSVAQRGSQCARSHVTQGALRDPWAGLYNAYSVGSALGRGSRHPPARSVGSAELTQLVEEVPVSEGERQWLTPG